MARGAKAIADEKTKPPSTTAMAFLQDASSKTRTVVDQVKTVGKQLAALSLPAAQRTYSDMMQKALALSNVVSSEYLEEIGIMICLVSDHSTDAEVKALLLKLKT